MNLIRKDIQIAICLLYILNHNYVKILVLAFEIENKFKIKVSETVLRKIITTLKNHNLLIIGKGVGVKRANRNKINILDVYEALGVDWSQSNLNLSDPAGKIGRGIYNYIGNCYINYIEIDRLNNLKGLK
ncbi:MAG: hypothetical protein GTN36_02660 [Candidatus Aenigmarchaeota archaeon]|nr:hypothetical protein [Candidatus Aenigmarchaeota archaeon]